MGAIPKTAQYTLTEALMTTLVVLNIFSNNIKLGRYTAPVSGEKKPAAVTMRTMHHCRECEKAEYGGVTSGCGALSTSRFDVGVPGDNSFVVDLDDGLGLWSPDNTVVIGNSFLSMIVTRTLCN
jgi:hypothetical protein